VRRALPDLAALVCIAICALILHRDGLVGGPAFYELDTRLFYFPLAEWVSQQLHAGRFPLWLPGIFTGYPIFADGELGLAYLPQLAVLAALPAEIAMVWLRVIHVALAGGFTYAFLRTLRLGPLPALGGALVFAFGSFVTAQMHHENVVRSAVWLPAVLLCLERATWQPPRSTITWSALGALAFAQAALGLHVQPVLMATIALGGYVVFRALVCRRVALWALLSGATAIAGGLCLAAVQWIPLGEWALVSSRRGGVDYTFASAFALDPPNLLSVVFPFFYRLPDATTWWTLWQQWEIELYVGIPTLGLVLVGLVWARRVELFYFAILGVVSLWIGMAEYAPLFNLHQLLWALPGFSFLRAPARFSYLIVFACACLAAFGLQTVREHRARVALTGALPAGAILSVALVVFLNLHASLAADPTRALDLAQATYLAPRAQYPIDPQLVVNGFLSSLDVTTVKTAWSLTLLAITALAFLASWVASARIVQAGLVVLIAVDLLVFAYDFHPSAPLHSLKPDLAAPAEQRVILRDPVDLPRYEPDQLLAAGIPTTDGYSSLPSQRHVEVAQATSNDPRLFDLWSAPLVLEPPNPADAHTVDGVTFRAAHPLVAGFGGAPPQVLDVSGVISGVRIIGTLSYAYNVPQGQTVATVSAGGQILPIRAGIELSERAYDRPSLSGLLQHQKASVSLDFDETTPEGEDYIAHLYEADLTLSQPVAAGSITFTATDPSVLVELDGVGVMRTSGELTSLDLGNRDGFARLSETLFVNSNALPRAYVLPSAQAFSPARHPTLTATQLVTAPDVDVHRMVLIENDSNTPASPSGAESVSSAQSIEDLGPNEVRIVAHADAPSYLVLDDFYHRGWTARVDGQTTRVLIANALFRAVEIGPGTHVIDFVFAPISHVIGAAVSLLSLIAIGAALLWTVITSPARTHGSWL
jgi:hypothetical protein